MLPSFQRQGIGTALIERTKETAKSLGHRAIFIYGDPAYYGRFGFVGAETYGIGTPDWMYAEALLALELEKGALSACRGRFFEDETFDVDEAKAKAFDRDFPAKESRDDLPSQARFRYLLSRWTPMSERPLR